MTATDALDACLRDLQTQAERKLRHVAAVRQLLQEYRQSRDAPLQERLHRDIVSNIEAVVTISKSIRTASGLAFDAAMALQ